MISKYLAWAFCLAFVAGTTLSSFGSIFCLGDNGLTIIELICQPYCTGSKQSCSLEETIPDGDLHDDCTNCTNLSLSRDVFSKRPSRSTPETGSKVDLASTAITITHADQARITCLYQNMVSSSLALISSLQSTAILRC